jgi:uncharacterized protein (TIGR00369 family)
VSTPASQPPSGAEVMRQFLPNSPFVGHLGIQLVDLQPDMAVLVLPFIEALVTIGSIVHGGAIASLIDTAAMAAAWSSTEIPSALRSTTVSLTVAYLAPADHEDLQALARAPSRSQSRLH